jgi:hypothetical protein
LKSKKQKKNDSRGVWSLVLGIASWVGILTVVVPIICGIISIIQGSKALKNNTKHKICAIAGIILSILVFIFIIWSCISPSSSSDVGANKSESVATEEVDENKLVEDVEIEQDKTEQKETEQKETEQRETEQSEVEQKKFGIIVEDGFDSDSSLVSSEEVISDIYSNTRYDNIKLISHEVKEYDEEMARSLGYNKADKVEAMIAYYDEKSGVGVTQNVKVVYTTSDSSRGWLFNWIVTEKTDFDISSLEGKTLDIMQGFEGNIMSLLGVDYNPYTNSDFSATVTVHNVDSIKMVELDEDIFNGKSYVQSKKPVLKIMVTYDGKEYEGDYCLGCGGFSGAETSEFYCNSNGEWELDFYVKYENTDDLEWIQVDLDSIR